MRQCVDLNLNQRHVEWQLAADWGTDAGRGIRWGSNDEFYVKSKWGLCSKVPSFFFSTSHKAATCVTSAGGWPTNGEEPWPKAWSPGTRWQVLPTGQLLLSVRTYNKRYIIAAFTPPVGIRDRHFWMWAITSSFTCQKWLREFISASVFPTLWRYCIFFWGTFKSYSD